MKWIEEHDGPIRQVLLMDKYIGPEYRFYMPANLRPDVCSDDLPVSIVLVYEFLTTSSRAYLYRFDRIESH